MSPVLITLIIIVSVLGAYIVDYQKNKLKWQSKNKQSDKELEELRKLMHQLKKRIENLEAIAADSPDDFNKSNIDPVEQIEINDSESIKKENEKNAARIANSKSG